MTEHRSRPTERAPERHAERRTTFTGNRGLQHRGAADLRDRAQPARLRRRSAGAAEGQRPRSDGLRRTAPIGLPGLSEPEVVRHYVRLSQKNYAIDMRRLSARLVHHEAQSAPQREDGAAAGLRRPPSAAAGLDRAGRARADRPSWRTG